MSACEQLSVVFVCCVWGDGEVSRCNGRNHYFFPSFRVLAGTCLTEMLLYASLLHYCVEHWAEHWVKITHRRIQSLFKAGLEVMRRGGRGEFLQTPLTPRDGPIPVRLIPWSSSSKLLGFDRILFQVKVTSLADNDDVLIVCVNGC